MRGGVGDSEGVGINHFVRIRSLRPSGTMYGPQMTRTWLQRIVPAWDTANSAKSMLDKEMATPRNTRSGRRKTS